MPMVLRDGYIGYMPSSATLGSDTLNYGRTMNTNNFFPFKNKIINGDFRVNQISGTNTASNLTTRYFPIDRWFTQGTLSGRFTTQIVNDGPSTSSTYSSIRPATTLSTCVELKATFSTILGSTDVYAFGQNIEGRNMSDIPFGGGNSTYNMVLSFWIKVSQTGIYTFRLHNSAVNRTLHQAISIGTANVWTFVQFTIPVDSTGEWLKDFNTGLRFIVNLGVGSSYRGTSALTNWASTATELCHSTTTIHLVETSNATIRLTGVQLEFIGTNTSTAYASPFEFRPFPQELDLCLRYFQKSWTYATVTGTQTTIGMYLFTDMNASNVQHYNHIRWSGGPMRAPPTIELYGYNSPGNAGYGTIWVLPITNYGDFVAYATAIQRSGCMMYSGTSAVHTLEGFHFKLNAEMT